MPIADCTSCGHVYILPPARPPMEPEQGRPDCPVDRQSIICRECGRVLSVLPARVPDDLRGRPLRLYAEGERATALDETPARALATKTSRGVSAD